VVVCVGTIVQDVRASETALNSDFLIRHESGLALFYAKAGEHLASDPQFRAALLADPRAAASKRPGLAMPDAVQVEVHEEALTHILLVIPTPSASGEISDVNLELVAGGDMCWSHGCALCKVN